VTTSWCPVRGQVVLVGQVGVEQWLLAQTDPEALTYVVPRERTVVLGGTAHVGATDLEPDRATAAAVLERCTALVPGPARRARARPPGRPAPDALVRAARGRDAGRRAPVVHDYGHGGAGVTLSYGCAATSSASSPPSERRSGAGS
jgi:D-amino-acid oxidase